MKKKFGKFWIECIFRTADPSKPLDTYVNVEFLTWPIIRYKREVLFGWVDLLVSFGGIAGLFLGFSLLSGVEIIYYFTLRTFCMFHKNRVGVQRKVFAENCDFQISFMFNFIHVSYE